MSRKAVAFGLAAGVAGLGVWLGVNGAPRAAPQDAGDGASMTPVLQVSVVQARHQAVNDDIRVIGTVVPREKVVVAPEMTGLRVRAVFAEAGDHVRKGQPLALLDGESLGIQLQSLQGEFDRTREDYARFKTLHTSDATSRESVEERQAAFETARSKLLDAQLSLARTRIVAPTDGFIYERTATIGGLTNASEPLFRIARDGEVEMEASVPEALVRRIRHGMAATVNVLGESDTVSGSVRLVMPMVDAGSRSAGVRIRLAPGRKAPVGAFGEARITVGRAEGWVVPGTALQQDEQGLFVWQVGRGSVVTRKGVTLVARTAESAVLNEALKDAAIVAKAGSFLHEGDVVAVAKR